MYSHNSSCEDSAKGEVQCNIVLIKVLLSSFVSSANPLFVGKCVIHLFIDVPYFCYLREP